MDKIKEDQIKRDKFNVEKGNKSHNIKEFPKWWTNQRFFAFYEMNEIDKLIRYWSKDKEIKGGKFDKIFNIEGIPLWWFYQIFFTSYAMPKPLNTFKFIDKNKKLKINNKIKLFSNAKVLKKLFLLNEKRKIKFFKKKKDFTQEEKVLFLSYSNHLSEKGEVFRIQNMIDKIRKDQKIKELVLFADPLSIKDYKKLVNHDNIYSYYDEKISNKAEAVSKELFKKWENIDEKTKNDFLKSENISLWPYLKYSFDFFFSPGFLYLISLYCEIWKKIIKKENIKVIVLTSQNGFFEKCLIPAAEKFNVPILQIQHGLGGLSELIYPSTGLVFSDFYKNHCIKLGKKEEELVVTGPIIFDDIKECLDKQKQENEKKHFRLHIKDCRLYMQEKKEIKNILIVTSVFVEGLFLTKEVYFKRITKILKSIKEIKEIEIFIKLHPREKYKKEYIKIIKKLNLDNAKIFQNIGRKEFYKLMSQCDAFINFGSTAGLEAMIMDKPVVTIDIADIKKGPLKNNLCLIVLESDAGININHNDDITTSVQKALNDEKEFKIKRKEFVKKYCYKIDGKAHERAVNYIYSLLNGQ